MPALQSWFLSQLYIINAEDLLKYINHVLVSAQEAFCSQLLKIYHNCLSDDHWEQNKTLNLIHWKFIWSEITENICEYIIICSVCQEKTIHWHKSYEKLKALSVSSDVISFKEISLNWITDLLIFIQNNQEFDNILTVVCCIIKYTLFIFICEASTAVEFAELFFEHVECCFETSRNIVMNRDSCIISEFWWEICKIQMIKKHMSTVYHSQIND